MAAVGKQVDGTDPPTPQVVALTRLVAEPVGSVGDGHAGQAVLRQPLEGEAARSREEPDLGGPVELGDEGGGTAVGSIHGRSWRSGRGPAHRIAARRTGGTRVTSRP